MPHLHGTPMSLVALAPLALLIAAPAARAQAVVCPPQSFEDRFVCFATGDITTPENRTSLTYAPTTPFVAGSEICAFVDVSAELEQGGWDQVFLRFTDGADPAGPTFVEHCLAGDDAEVCDASLSPGCEAVPTRIIDTSGTYCYQPTPGTAQVTISVFVKTLDSQYQCGDCGDQPGSPGVTVNALQVTGCNGFPTGACGDGIVAGAEGCDDGNTVARDGCSPSCAIEPGAVCNEAATACVARGACGGVTPGPLDIPYCYPNAADGTDTPLVWLWNVAADGAPLTLRFDVSGGLELYTDPDDPTWHYDELWLYWEDDLGGFDLVPLNVGQAMDEPAYEVWSRGALQLTPTAGATIVLGALVVFADASYSCVNQPPLDTIDPLVVGALTLGSCEADVVTAYDSFASFTDAIGGCYTVVDFNGYGDGYAGPIGGDGFSAYSDAGQPFPLRVEHAPYPSTFANGDGTPALDPQIPERYQANSRLRVDFAPERARAIGLTFVDVGDIGGVMGLEGWRDGRLVFFEPDLGVSDVENNFIATRGFVFDEPVDSVVFSMLEPADHFNLDNLVIVPQLDADDDGVPDLCDCAPGDPRVAGAFAESCDDGADNDCDGFADGDDPDCGGAGSASCQTYFDEPLDQTSGGWLVSGDTSWAWSAARGRWEAASRNAIAATLETQPFLVPAAACPGDFKLELELGGVVASDGDALVVAAATNGGTFATLLTLTGTLGPRVVDLTGRVAPGDVVSLRFVYVTNASGVAAGPSIGRVRLFADEDGDADLVCDGCDCAPGNAAFGLDCDLDDDGWCAATTGPLNPSATYAGCALDVAGGDPLAGGSDCHDDKPLANPGLASESAFCGDGLDNACDGASDGADPDCAAPACVDGDADGYGVGAGCLGADCLEGVAACTTDCADRDADLRADCDPADACIDVDKDGYGVGAGCNGPDCNDQIGTCAVDCTTDLDSDRIPDCAETCVDADGDLYGVGPGCLGLDCDDGSIQCTTSCVDVDDDQRPDCRDGCIDRDSDGFGTGASCGGPDCDDQRPTCTTSCVDVAPANGVPDCAQTCDDADADGYGVGTGCLGADCLEGVSACNVSCRDVDEDETFDCNDRCIDADADGYGVGPDCAGVDCDDAIGACTTSCVDADRDSRLDCDPLDDCDDADKDGYGVGPGCAGADCDDAVATCAVDCATDLDDDGTPDCAQVCVDGDKDGYGVGPGCAGADCDDEAASCTTSCVDLDLDQVADCEDPCFDADKDGFGDGPGCTAADCDDDRAACTTDCADGNTNGTPDCAEDCVDGDGDGFGVGTTCLGADCDDDLASCTTTCVDHDVDGRFDCGDGCIDLDKDGHGVGPECAGADCDDSLRACTTSCVDANDNQVPDCNEGCRDQDQDGYGLGADCTELDCDDRFAACTTVCTHSDSDGLPDCGDDDDDGDGLKDGDEARYNTNPLDPDSDDDGLFDGAEVTIHETSPTNRDTDGDGLSDGNEVLIHTTSPTDPDTDRGGVPDGAEVAAGTNPLDPSDDMAGRFEGSSACAGGDAGAGSIGVGLALLALALRRRRR
ncbi:MAG: hypothetical protein IT385_05810 [Deltaproteobacteria bacterium]|nr:hypothetical protein [Deltaproteobacteria bacterium]